MNAQSSAARAATQSAPGAVQACEGPPMYTPTARYGEDAAQARIAAADGAAHRSKA